MIISIANILTIGAFVLLIRAAMEKLLQRAKENESTEKMRKADFHGMEDEGNVNFLMNLVEMCIPFEL